MKIKKDFKWAMAHVLEDHKGLCKNVHGHNYRAVIDVEAEELIDGMVMDFKDLKEIVNEVIIEPMDHAFGYNKNNEKSKQVAEFLEKELDQKTFEFGFRATAENMAKFIYETLNGYFLTREIKVTCSKVSLFETDDSCAVYEGKDAN